MGVRVGIVLAALAGLVVWADGGSRPLFALQGRFWLILACAYTICVLAVSRITGVSHWTGRRRLLLFVELGLIAAIGWAMPAPAAALAVLLVHSSIAGGLLEPYAVMAVYLALGVVCWAFRAESLVAALGGASAITIVALVGSSRATRHRSAIVASELQAEKANWRAAAARQRAEAVIGEVEAFRVDTRQHEVLNWINLTAGLTHSIGNEVLAFDHYSAIALEYLEGAEGDVPDHITDAVRFIHDTNSARLGFINFLQEFAEIMKLAGAERRVPVGLREIDLVRLIHRVRAQVGRFESHELDPEDSDPQIQKQRRKNLELELIVHAQDAAARMVARGREPVLEFICYEFIKNSLRNCSGERRLKVRIASRGSSVSIRFINDIDVEARAAGDCSACAAAFDTLLGLRNESVKQSFCDDCLRQRIEENLTHCWAPGRTSQGGKGLGLFVIRHFLTRYYFGDAVAGVMHWPTREVFFEVQIPHDLAVAIGEYNARAWQRA